LERLALRHTDAVRQGAPAQGSVSGWGAAVDWARRARHRTRGSAWTAGEPT